MHSAHLTALRQASGTAARCAGPPLPRNFATTHACAVAGSRRARTACKAAPRARLEVLLRGLPLDLQLAPRVLRQRLLLQLARARLLQLLPGPLHARAQLLRAGRAARRRGPARRPRHALAWAPSASRTATTQPRHCSLSTGSLQHGALADPAPAAPLRAFAASNKFSNLQRTRFQAARAAGAPAGASTRSPACCDAPAGAAS